FTRGCRAPRENKNREPVRRNVTVKLTKTKALVAQDRLGYNWSDQAKEGPTNFTLMAYTCSGSSSFSSSNSEVSTCSKACAYKAGLESVKARLDVYTRNEIQVSDKFKTGVGFDSQVVDIQVFDSQENDRYKTSEGYHAVPLPYTGNFMPLKYYLVLADEEEYVFSESVTIILEVTTSKAKTSVSKPKSVGEPLIEDWISDSEDENETEFKESVKKIENNKQAKYPRKNSQSPRDYDLCEKKMVEKTVWNNARRANHQNYQRMTHPHPKGNFVPKAVLLKSSIKSLNTARPINISYTRPTVNSARKASNVLNKAHTHVRRPFNKSTTNKNNNLKEKVNTVKGDVTTARPKSVVSNNKENEANAVKASACWVWRPKQKVLDHVFRHNGASMNFKRFDYVNAQGISKSIMAWVLKRA
ncbi:hypothetical protein Tco_1498163, partial [Tanacetum coccineum]